MKKSNRGGYKGKSWKELEKIIARGHSRDRVFTDWLDLTLEAFLSITNNIQRGNTDPTKFDGPHEARYLDIVEKYKTNQKAPERPIDHFVIAFGKLLCEIEETQKDCLGDIYESEITYGEHGQFFTPEPVADMIALITAPSKSEEGREVICDPACGSGRMLMAAHKQNPSAFFVGVDLDPRCAKMCTLNLMIRRIEGDVYEGDSLAGKMRRVWNIRHGVNWSGVVEHDMPETPDRLKKYAEDQKQLSLL